MINQLKINFDTLMDSEGLDALIYPWAGWAPLLAGFAKLPIVRLCVVCADVSAPRRTS
jgi:hypothetical protein